MVNGEGPHSASNPGMLEETLHQMNILIQENRDLKGKREGVLSCSTRSSFFLVLFAFIPFLNSRLLCAESLRQTNLMMKDRFEDLAVWREKQRGEQDILERQLEEARVHMEALTHQNRELSGKTGEDGNLGGAAGDLGVRRSRDDIDLLLTCNEIIS